MDFPSTSAMDLSSTSSTEDLPSTSTAREEDSDAEEDCELFSEHNTESEESILSSESDNEETVHTNFYLGKNKCFLWKKEQPPCTVRTRKRNIKVKLPQSRPKVKQLGDNPTPENIWNLLFDSELIKTILVNTNLKIALSRQTFSNRDLWEIKDTDEVEIRAFIGLLLYSSIFKSGNESVHSLFSTDGCGRDIFRATMLKQRFLFLLKCLRFDNIEDRNVRMHSDNLAAISNIFNRFIANCQDAYSLGEYVCIDEMLVPFRGRCSFRMHLPNKPTKYGIKLLCLTDARNNYLYNAYIYAGNGWDGATLTEEDKCLNLPTQAVIRLVKPIVNTNRNVTGDNWFSSIELVQELLKRGLTYVGTLKSNNGEIPPEFHPDRKRIVGSCIYGFTDEMTLLSYVPKKGKAVNLISTMHPSVETDVVSGKPEIIATYNVTKGGVDSLDKKCGIYSDNRRSKRWPTTIFYQLLNISAINSFIIFQSSKKDTEHYSRMDFVKAIADSLIIPHLQRRHSILHSRDLRNCIERILLAKLEVIKMESESENIIEDKLIVKKTCKRCPPKIKRKTYYVCSSCRDPVCLQCTKKVCFSCFSDGK